MHGRAGAWSTVGVIVDTLQGKVEGTAGDGVWSFKGIPYAAPPVGARRFLPPAPPQSWEGVRPAATHGPVMSQNASLVERIFGGTEREMSEDALTLNVWTAGTDAARPVLVWIHGGAFTTGSGSIPWYDGTRFARKGAVVVTINYRLGALGFLHLGDIAGEAYASSGNNGLLDQVAALEWVRDNIAAFGGDPGNVTVFGESAGAMSIGTLLGMPRAKGLFHKAILQSGAASHVESRERGTKVARELLDALGTDVAGLHELPVERILAVSGNLGEAVGDDELRYLPTVDGVTFPQPPLDAIAAGLNADVPVLIGTTRDEWNLFALGDPRFQGLDDVALQAHAANLFRGHERAARAIETYRGARPNADAAALLSGMITDSVFRIPALRLVERHLEAGGRAHVYLFTWATPAFDGRLGSCHALEIPFVFDNLDAPGVNFLTGGSAPQSLADAMHDAWLRFAGTGDPGWTPYDVDRRPTMVFDAESAVQDDPQGVERRCWEDVR